jgi:hypothetical protein
LLSEPPLALFNKWKLIIMYRILPKIINSWALAVMIIGFLFIFAPLQNVSALSESQSKIFNSGVYYYDTDIISGCSDTKTGISSTLPSTVPEPYKTLFTQAAAEFKMNPQFLAAIFLTENGNVWKPIDTKWSTSKAGASGPFQFMPATWDAFKTDGNNDGIEDINNIYDATYSAANMLGRVTNGTTPLGSLATPYRPGTLLYYAAGYNWGTGNVELHTDPDSPLDTPGVPEETKNYVKNIYALITSGFTKSGHPNYPDPKPILGSSSSSSSGATTNSTICPSGGGIVAGNIVETAIGLAWPSGDHGKNKEDATPAYQDSMPKYNGSTGDDEWSDCGVFVATVMIATNADPDYPKRGTTVQAEYLQNNSSKYKIIRNVQDTSQLQPGDILIYNGPDGGHTFIYTGQRSGFQGDSAAASLHSHVPQAGYAANSFNFNDRASSGNYFAARLK